MAGKTRIYWDTEAGFRWRPTAAGLLLSMVWQCVLEYYWHRLGLARGNHFSHDTSTLCRDGGPFWSSASTRCETLSPWESRAVFWESNGASRIRAGPPEHTPRPRQPLRPQRDRKRARYPLAEVCPPAVGRLQCLCPPPRGIHRPEERSGRCISRGVLDAMSFRAGVASFWMEFFSMV